MSERQTILAIDMGMARMFGFRLPINFNSPYKAASIIDFWRRWHITLSRFMLDYLYIALGGNRKGEFRRYANLLFTMLLGGLWHGANWTFVVWGGLHGLMLGINHAWHWVKRNWDCNWDSPVYVWACRLLTFTCVMLAWVRLATLIFALFFTGPAPTLEDLVGLINNDEENPGVTASLLYQGDKYHLMLSGQRTGEDNQISLNASSTEVWASSTVGGSFTDDGENAALAAKITELDKIHSVEGSHIFYLATPPFL